MAEESENNREVWGLYEASCEWRWGLFCPQKGDVMIVRVPPPFSLLPDAYGAFVVLGKALMTDGSLMVTVKSLGCTDVQANPSLSKSFNRKEGSIHCCHDLGHCGVTEDVVFHCTTVELRDGSSFTADFVGAAGKRTLKLARQDVGEENYSPERELPAQEEAFLADGERLKAAAANGKGGVLPSADKPEGEKKHAVLRERLEKAKRKREVTSGQPLEVREQEAAPTPALTSHAKLGRGDEHLKNAWRTLAQMETAPAVTSGPTMNPWNAMQVSKDIGSQLMMRAAANYQEDQGGGPPGPGGGAHPVWGGPQKKKKKKKKKDKRKSKKRKRKFGRGGGSSGGGGSGGSSGSSDISSSSSSSTSSGDSVNLPPLRRKSEKKPGSVLKVLLGQIESQLSEVQGYDGNPSAVLGGTKVLTYFHLLVRGSGVQVGSRDGREMYLCAVLLDLLRSGQLDKLADGLAARFMALQTAVMDGGWQAARHLEIFTPDIATPGGPAITLAARKHAKVLEKVLGKEGRSEASGSRTWGRGWSSNSWQKGEDSYNPETGKGKGKKGKGKGKGNPWSGKGYNNWRGGAAGEGKSGEKEKGGDKTSQDAK